MYVYACQKDRSKLIQAWQFPKIHVGLPPNWVSNEIDGITFQSSVSY